MKNELEIDLYHLDEGWLELPSLSDKWNTKAVEMDVSVMNTKNELDLLKSQLDISIRANPENFGLSKITEGSIASTIADSPSVKKLSDKYFELLSEYKRTKSYCASISVKEKSLRGLTDLHTSGYFNSKPICAMEITTEKETSKLNTKTNIDRMKKKLKTNQ